MSTSLRLAKTAIALTAAAFLLVGCAAESGDSAPTEGPGSDATSAGEFEVEAAWLDNGRMAAIVTWGSSSCVPIADEITADGQTVTVGLTEGPADQACTADLAPRASLVALPDRVDPAKDVEFIITLQSNTGDADLEGNASLTGVPGESTDYLPSAGWYDDGSLVLLTWGSSSCPPIVESVEGEGSSGKVTFKTEDRACTMDMAPRATIIEFGELGDDADESFVLTLVGDNLDAELNVVDG